MIWIAAAVLLFMLLLRPISDTDIFWQLKLGELILANGAPLASEPFAMTHLGEPLPTVAWLGQAVMAGVRLASGWTGLRVFDAVVWLGGFLAAAQSARRHGARPLAATLALAIGFALALPAASLRPQSFAALGFGLTLVLIQARLPLRQSLVWATPLFLLWQNLHPSLSVAVIVLGACAVVAWLRHFTGREAAQRWTLSALTLLAALLMFATPEGFGIVGVSTVNAQSSLAMGATEWFPAWSPVNRGFVAPFAAIMLVAAVLVVRERKRIGWVDLVPALVLFAMTLLAIRFLLFLGIALVPPLARAAIGREVEPGMTWRWGPLALAAAILLSLPLQPTGFAAEIPLKTIAQLKATGAQGTVFSFFGWGGPLIDAGHPRWKVAFDGRYYRYSAAEWQHYRDAAAGRLPLAELDRIYRPAAYLLEPYRNAGLVAELRAAPAEWRGIATRERAVLFVRR